MAGLRITAAQCVLLTFLKEEFGLRADRATTCNSRPVDINKQQRQTKARFLQAVAETYEETVAMCALKSFNSAIASFKLLQHYGSLPELPLSMESGCISATEYHSPLTRRSCSISWDTLRIHRYLVDWTSLKSSLSGSPMKQICKQLHAGIILRIGLMGFVPKLHLRARL